MGILTALKKIAQLGVDGAVDVGSGTFKSYEQIVAEVGLKPASNANKADLDPLG